MKHRIAGNCGAQCLYTLLVAEEALKIDYGQFLDQYPVCRNTSMSLVDLDQIAIDHVINGELIRFDPSKDLPAYRHLIAHVKPDHFVLLSQSTQGIWYCVDPPGMPYVLTEGVTATLSGNAFAVGAPRESLALDFDRYFPGFRNCFDSHPLAQDFEVS